MSKMKTGTVGVVLIGGALALWIGARRQQASLLAHHARLVRSGTAEVDITEAIAALDAAPAPVARYLRLALRNPKPIREVRLIQEGTLRTDPAGERWMPFSAEQVVVPPANGFVWNARVGVAPLLHVRVHDSLIEGQGAGQVSLLSAIALSGVAGTPEMNSGALHRYLAEAVWYPTALLPSHTLKWTPIDASKALATLTNHGISVSLEFWFAETGEVSGIYTPARWGTFAGGYRQAAWEGHFRGYREHDGVLVPAEGEVGWYVEGEWRAVWKGTITAFQVQFAD